MTLARRGPPLGRSLDDLLARIAPCFGRIEPRRRARSYLQGCSPRSSARTAGIWPKPPVMPALMACRISSPACIGMRMQCAMICAPM
jgi:hypothetical protein